MTSGIYKFNFSDGTYYIGKSIDIDKRWGQHSKSMLEGKHSTRVQAAFNRCGPPEYTIVMLCHEHHIDMMETMFINHFWGPQILNGTRPKAFSEEEYKVLRNIPEHYWNHSTFRHIADLIDLKSKIDIMQRDLEEAEEAFEETLSDIKDGTLLGIMEREKKQYKF